MKKYIKPTLEIVGIGGPNIMAASGSAATASSSKRFNMGYIHSLARNIVLDTLHRQLDIDIEDIHSNSTFSKDLGCDGLDMAELVMSLEQVFDIIIEDSIIMDDDTTINERFTVLSMINHCADKMEEELITAGGASLNTNYIHSLVQNIVLTKLQTLSGEELENIHPNSTLFPDLGCDELDRVDLLMSLEGTLGITLDESIASGSATVQLIIDHCANKTESCMRQL